MINMNILFDNVNLDSSSGPNSFAAKLVRSIISNSLRLDLKGNIFTSPPSSTEEKINIQLSFIHSVHEDKEVPIIQRLDGIYFNSMQDWKSLNAPIRETYEKASGVIFQSRFNKMLTEHYFGKKEHSVVINNGANLDEIAQIPVQRPPDLDKFEDIWVCASSWRPHKRLSENIRYFMENAGSKDCLLIAGDNAWAQASVQDPRVFYTGHLNWKSLISLYKGAKYFIHLALMDHCPNVVVDARAAGCKIICSSSGGTKEIAGDNSVIIEDMEWDLKPFELYSPPMLDFSRRSSNKEPECSIDMNNVTSEYVSFLRKFL